LLQGSFASSRTDVVGAIWHIFLETEWDSVTLVCHCPFRELGCTLEWWRLLRWRVMDLCNTLRIRSLALSLSSSTVATIWNEDFFQKRMKLLMSTTKRNRWCGKFFFENTESFEHPSLVDGRNFLLYETEDKSLVESFSMGVSRHDTL
jgi:hypothetical protein